MRATLKNTTIERIDHAASKLTTDIIREDAGQRSDYVKMYALLAILASAKTVLFPAEQAEVFAALSHEYTDRLNYALPFEQTLIEFMVPVPVQGRQLLGIALSQDTFDNEDFNQFAQSHGMKITGRDDIEDHTEIHQAVGIYADGYSLVTWKVHSREIIFDPSADAALKNLSIAVIGYINCENVTLALQNTDAKVNRKRISKGKKPLDAFYVTRIRGVQYEAKESQQTGRHVGFRFDVRGHFRRLEDGRTTWVKAHQRGVQHELYKPKVYEVE